MLVLNFNNNTYSAVILQKRAIRIVTKSDNLAHTEPLYKMLRILKISDLFKFHVLVYMLKTVKCNYDNLLALLQFQAQIHNHNTRNASLFRLPNFKKSTSRFSLQYRGPELWNNLPCSLRKMTNINKFKSQIKDICFAEY